MMYAIELYYWQMHSFVSRYVLFNAQMKWFKDLKEVEEYHKSGAHHNSDNTQTQTTTVRERFSSPIPGFADREFLLTKV